MWPGRIWRRSGPSWAAGGAEISVVPFLFAAVVL